MLVISSRNQVPIRLTEERWGHIARRHPEMAAERERGGRLPGAFHGGRIHCDGLFHESPSEGKGGCMEALKILEKPETLTWDYDEEGDVLYISVGEPRPAVTIDLGESILARYDEKEREVVGITILNVRRRLLEG